MQLIELLYSEELSMQEIEDKLHINRMTIWRKKQEIMRVIIVFYTI